jgi:hypothetical protein
MTKMLTTDMLGMAAITQAECVPTNLGVDPTFNALKYHHFAQTAGEHLRKRTGFLNGRYPFLVIGVDFCQ